MAQPEDEGFELAAGASAADDFSDLIPPDVPADAGDDDFGDLVDTLDGPLDDLGDDLDAEPQFELEDLLEVERSEGAAFKGEGGEAFLTSLQEEGLDISPEAWSYVDRGAPAFSDDMPIRLNLTGLTPAAAAYVRQRASVDPKGAYLAIERLDQAKRVGIDLNDARNLEQLFATQAPPEFNYPTAPQALLTPLARIPAAFAGAAVKTSMAALQRRSVSHGALGEVELAYDRTEQDLERILKESEGTGFSGFMQDLGKDLSDNVVALADMASILLGEAGDVEEDLRRMSSIDYLVEQAKKGYKGGEDIAIGGIAMPLAFAANPKKFAEARPLTTLFILLPLLQEGGAFMKARRGGQGTLSPAFRRMYDKLPEGFREKLASTGSRAFNAVRRFGGHGEHTLAQGIARAFKDPYRGPSKKYSRRYEETLTSPAEGEAAIVAGTEEFARQVEQQRILPEEVAPTSTLADMAKDLKKGSITVDDLIKTARAMNMSGEVMSVLYAMFEDAVPVSTMHPARALNILERMGAPEGALGAFKDAEAAVALQGTSLDRVRTIVEVIKHPDTPEAVAVWWAASLPEHASRLLGDANLLRQTAQTSIKLSEIAIKEAMGNKKLSKATVGQIRKTHNALIKQFKEVEAVSREMDGFANMAMDSGGKTTPYETIYKAEGPTAAWRTDIDLAPGELGGSLVHSKATTARQRVLENMSASERKAAGSFRYEMGTAGTSTPEGIAQVQQSYLHEHVQRVATDNPKLRAALGDAVAETQKYLSPDALIADVPAEPYLRGERAAISDAAPRKTSAGERLGFTETTSASEASIAAAQDAASAYFTTERAALDARRVELQNVKTKEARAERRALRREMKELDREKVLVDESLAREGGRFKQAAAYGYVPEEMVARIFASAMRDDSVQLLRDPNFRHAVTKRILKKNKGSGLTYDGVNQRLKTMGESTLLDIAFDYKVDLPEGGIVSFFETMVETVADTKPKKMAKYRADAIRQVGGFLAEESYKRRASAILKNEVNRFKHFRGEEGQPGTQVKGPGEYRDNLVNRVLVHNEPRPLLMTSYKPKDVARGLGAELLVHAETVQKGLAEKGITVSLEEATRRVETLRENMTGSYTAPSSVLLEELPVNYHLLQDVDYGTLMRGKDLPPIVTAVDYGYNSMLHNHFSALKAMREVDSVIDGIMVGLKANLTVRNALTHVNNFVSNLYAFSMKLGKDPVSVVAQVVRTGLEWRRYTKGKAGAAATRDFAAMERVGLFETDLVDVELANLENGGLISRIGIGERSKAVSRAIGKAWGKFGSAMAAGYKLGDGVFKMDVGLRTMKAIASDMGRLDVGEWLRLQTGTHKEVFLIKQDGGVWTRTHKEPSWTKGDNIGVGKATDVKLLDTFRAKAASKVALDILVDYGKAPGIIKWQRSTRYLGAFTPFMTWAWWVMDVPGLKKGIVGRILEGPGGPVMRTNSEAVTRNHLKTAAVVSLRRAMLIGGAREHLLQQPADKIRDSLAWGVRGPGVVITNVMSDPDFLSYKDVTSMFYAGPTSTVLRGITYASTMLEHGLLRDAELPEDPREEGPPLPGAFEAYDAEEKQYDKTGHSPAYNRSRLLLKAKAGRVFGASDMLDLAGLNGHPTITSLLDVYEASDRGEYVPAYKWMKVVMPLAMSGIGTRLTDLAIAGTAGQESEFTSASNELRYVPPEALDRTEGQRLLRMAAMKFFGWGWKKTNLPAQQKRYLAKMKRVYTNALLKSAQRKTKAAKGALAAAEAGGAVVEALRMEKRIEHLENIQADAKEQVEWAVQDISATLDGLNERLISTSKKQTPEPDYAEPTQQPGPQRPVSAEDQNRRLRDAALRRLQEGR